MSLTSVSDSTLLWSWLNVLTKDRYDAMTQVYGNLDEAAVAINEELLRGLGCREETVRSTLMRLEEFDAESYMRAMEKAGVQFLTIEHDRYPRLLAQIPDPPPFLYFRGDLSILDQPCIGIVGTRQMSIYGRRVAETFVPELVAAGLVTVSGLAQGIDAEVANQTLKRGGRTVAVLGHGLGMIYPKSNEKLARNIVDGGGLLLSEFPLDFAPSLYSFPARNRIIAALSMGTVVLEAPEGSGAIITAKLALDYNRDVFAVPGHIFDPNYEGCHQLIASKHAALVSKPSDILQALGIITSEQPAVSSFVPATPDEEKIHALLTSLPQPVDDLVARSGLAPGQVSATLTMMELSGGAKNVGGGQWVRM